MLEIVDEVVGVGVELGTNTLKDAVVRGWVLLLRFLEDLEQCEVVLFCSFLCGFFLFVLLL